MENNKIIEFTKGIGILFLMFIGIPFISLIFLEIFKLFTNDPNKFISTINIMSQSMLLIIYVLIFRKEIKKDFLKLKETGKKDFGYALKIWIICFLIMTVTLYIINTFINTGNIAANEETNRNTLESFPIYSVLSMVIIGPILEEITFRVGFKKAFSNIIAFSIFSGLIFGGAHLLASLDAFSWKQMLYIIPYGTLGFGFAYLYHKTDNMFMPISVHMIHNGLTVGLLLLSTFLTGMVN